MNPVNGSDSGNLSGIVRFNKDIVRAVVAVAELVVLWQRLQSGRQLIFNVGIQFQFINLAHQLIL